MRPRAQRRDARPRRMVVRCGRAGKAAGAGFYDYSPEGDKRLWSGLRERFPSGEKQPPVQGLIERLLYTQALEAFSASSKAL